MNNFKSKSICRTSSNQIKVRKFNRMTNMKVSLAVVVFSAMLYIIDASCGGRSNCVDSSGNTYAPGSQWTERYSDYCMECSCLSVDAASCCTTGYISSFPDHCADIFDDQKCVHHLVEKSDPCTPCSGGSVSAVGK